MPVCIPNSPPLLHLRTACINRNFVRDAPQDLIIVMIKSPEVYAPLGETSSTLAKRVCLVALIFILALARLVNFLIPLAIAHYIPDGTLDLHPHPRRGGSLSSSALTLLLTFCSCTYVPSYLLTCPTIVLADLPFLSGICRSIFQSAAACKNA